MSAFASLSRKITATSSGEIGVPSGLLITKSCDLWFHINQAFIRKYLEVSQDQLTAQIGVRDKVSESLPMSFKKFVPAFILLIKPKRVHPGRLLHLIKLGKQQVLIALAFRATPSNQIPELFGTSGGMAWF